MIPTYSNQEEQKTEMKKSNAASGIELDAPFGDGMILQRNRPVALRGKCAPLSRVHVQMQGRDAWGYSSAEGRFTLWFPPLDAAESLEMIVEANGESRTFENVAVGDVYLISGQSNMEFHLEDCAPGIELFSEDDLSHIRYFRIATRSAFGVQQTVPGEWIDVAKNAGGLSGLGMLFAREMYNRTKVPVGLVEASRGGMPIETFISRVALLGLRDYRDEVLRYDLMASTIEACDEEHPALDGNFGRKLTKGVAKLFPTAPEDSGESFGYARDDFDDSSWETMEVPGSWTLAGHNHAGYFWFRRTVEMPSDAEKYGWKLHLGVVDKSDRAFVNGRLVGETGVPNAFGGRGLRVYDIPSGTLKAGKNVLSVWIGSMISDFEDGGLLGPENEMFLECETGGLRIPIAGTWRLKETLDAGKIGMEFMRTLGPGVTASLHCLYDNMIAPLGVQTFSGVLFYQGECNAICTASRYETLLRTMISDWRRSFEDFELPFFICQLPKCGVPRDFSPYSQWALIRDAQRKVAESVDNVECIVLCDTGHEVDLHPKDKAVVAARCAEMAIAYQENEREKARPPKCVSVKVAANEIILSFDGAPLAGDEACGFAVVSSDNKVALPKAKIVDGHAVAINIEAGFEPSAIYYAWSDNPIGATLKDIHGHVVGPFMRKI